MPDGDIPRFLDLRVHQLKELKRWPKRRQTHTFTGLCLCLGGMTLCIECSGVTGTGLGEYICKMSTCSAPVHSFYCVRVTGFPTQPKTATWSPASKASSPSKTSSGTSGGQRSCGVWCPRPRWSGRADTQVQKDATYRLITLYHLPRVEDSWTSSVPTAPQTSTTNSMRSHCSNKQCRRRPPSFATTCRRRVFLVWRLPLTADVWIILSVKPSSANLPLCSGRSRVPDHRSLPDPEIVSGAGANRCQQGKKIQLSCWGTPSVQNADHQDLHEVRCLCFKSLGLFLGFGIHCLNWGQRYLAPDRRIILFVSYHFSLQMF